MTTLGHPLTWRPWRERPLFLLAAWLNKHRMPQRLLRVFQFLMPLLSFTADSALSSPELRGQQALSSRGSLPGFGHGRGGLRQTRCRAEKGGDWGKEKGPGREDGAGRPSASGAGLSVIGSGAVKHPPSPHAFYHHSKALLLRGWTHGANSPIPPSGFRQRRMWALNLRFHLTVAFPD